jgi:2-oxo-4-hydroxy-4-carboxy-5-ureidoimidazoline decarboxylase
MDRATFTSALGDIFEQTPEIAAAAWEQQPFDSVSSLHQAMVSVMRSLSPDAQHALICAHPDLGSQAKMPVASVQEQASVGLDQLSPDQYQELLRLNQTYRDRFGFPFVVAVREHTYTSILVALRERLTHDVVTEQAVALAEISQIAKFRLFALIAEA